VQFSQKEGLNLAKDKLNFRFLKILFLRISRLQFMKKLQYIFSNKYLITGIAFAVWMMFFDRNDFPSQFRKYRELNKMEQNQKNMALLISNTRKELQLLKTNPETLEKYAREKYMMKKDNEDVYVVTFDSSSIR
jgi:cell division protein FtsB